MTTTPLKTRWTPTDVPLSEYPRPQLRRDNYVVLNGHWKYAITEDNRFPSAFDGFILVPYAPESLLSGVGRQLKPNEYLHYYRNFELPSGLRGGRLLLHFGAVDMDCRVFVNGVEVGGHRGGYNAFTLEITDAVAEGSNSLWVVVTDDTDTTGRTWSKQTFRRGGIWYTPTSGIWQTVWLEAVAEQYISDLKITVDYDAGAVTVGVNGDIGFPLSVAVVDSGKTVAEILSATDTVTIVIENFKSWSPEHPFLYDLKVTAGADTVTSYFGMRKFEMKEDPAGNRRFYLNNTPYFMHGLLDQGYFSDGMYTAPTDDALENDIVQAKRLGYNTLRKHIKTEPMRWYWHCDRLGMLVWQDMPSGGRRYKRRVTQIYPFVGIRLKDDNYRLFGRSEDASRSEFYREYREMIAQLYNVTSIAMWVPFNEGWGQFDALKAAELTKQLDPTRLVDHASGWHDQGGGDAASLHIYFKKVPKVSAKGRAVVLSEFGGYSHRIEGHSFNEKTFGYKVFRSRKELNDAFVRLYQEEVLPRIAEGLSADIYTQLTDVEDEVNGVMTFDRAVVKLDESAGDAVKRGIEKEMSKLF